MEALVRHLVEPIVRHPDAVRIKTVEGEATVLLELVVHPSDRDRVDGDKGRTLRAIRNVISAAAGSRKASLDLVEQHSDAPLGADEEDEEDEDSEESGSDGDASDEEEE